MRKLKFGKILDPARPKPILENHRKKCVFFRKQKKFIFLFLTTYSPTPCWNHYSHTVTTLETNPKAPENHFLICPTKTKKYFQTYFFENFLIFENLDFFEIWARFGQIWVSHFFKLRNLIIALMSGIKYVEQIFRAKSKVNMYLARKIKKNPLHIFDPRRLRHLDALDFGLLRFGGFGDTPRRAWTIRTFRLTKIRVAPPTQYPRTNLFSSRKNRRECLHWSSWEITYLILEIDSCRWT